MVAHRNPLKKARPDDRAVSPVIGVILMVAITVVLAATVYVYASGFGIQNTNPQHSIALTSASPLTANGGDQVKSYTISAATSGLRWSDMRLSVDGNPLSYQASPTGGASSWRVLHGGGALAGAGTPPAGTALSGDVLQVYVGGGNANGKTLRIVDATANAVILTTTLS